MNQGTVATMGSASISPAASPSSNSTSSHISSSRMRLSLSQLQSLATDGKVKFTPKEVEFFQSKGYLRTNTPPSSSDGTTAASTSSSSSSAGTLAASRAGSVPRTPMTPATIASPLVSSNSQGAFAKPPLPVAERLAPMSPAAMALLRQTADSSSPRTPGRARENKRPSQSFSSPKQSLPPFHNKVFEDTCSHLHPETPSSPSMTDSDDLPGFRRHSESSSQSREVLIQTATRLMQSVPENAPVQFDPAHLRRASIATTTPLVETPLGTHTVLYIASSPSQNLLSLPIANPHHLGLTGGRPLGSLPTHTAAMNNFKFPATSSAPSGSLSPSPSAANGSASPTLARTKRKSVPRRSPSGVESQDQAPGVIFQIPFGTPPMPSSSPRKASTSAGSFSPSIGEGQMAGQELTTPPSPASRAGLGIQCNDSFSEPDATHPFEQARPSSSNTGTRSPHKDDYFTDKTEVMAVGDIIVAAEETAARQAAVALPPSSHNGSAQESMPSPPQTSTVVSMEVMQNPGQTPGPTPSPKLVNGSQVFSVSDMKAEISQQKPTEDKPVERVDCKTVPINSCAQFLPTTNEQGRTSRASSAPTLSISAVVSTEHESGDQVDQRDLPLWAQRQNRIRRQSLLPRPELDFVSGSGILPPDNKDLSTRGGATIISYPVLLSDVMQVRIDEIEAKLAADGALYQQATEENESVEAGASPSSATADHSVSGSASHKRKKGIAKKSGGSLAFEDVGLFSDSEQRAGRRLNKRRQSRASVTPEAPESSVNPVRVVPERHGASIYRRGERHHHHYNNDRPSSSPSASPSPPARRGRQNMLGSPVKLGNGSNGGQFDDDDDVLDYENDESIMDHDGGDDYDDSYKAHKNRHQSGDRSSHARHVLAIPPGEVDIAMQLTRDMLSRRRHQSNDHDSHLRSLQPLLDAIQSENDGEVDEDESMEDDDDDDNDDDHLMERSEAKKGKGGAKSKVVSHKKGASNSAMGSTGANRKRKSDEPLQRSQAKKEKTATSTKGKATKATKKRSDVGASLESLATASMLVDLHSSGAGGKVLANNGGEARKIKKPKTLNGPLATSSMSGVSKPKAKVQHSAGASSLSGNSGSSDDSRKHCEACGAEETPCWRPGYDANSVLCNSCGLRYKKSGVYCTAVGCKYIPLKAEFAAMEEDRKKNGREHLQCFQCRQPVAPPSTPPTSSAAAAVAATS
ncbi:hypothetical protein EMPS_11055 [Entomortierella parvispora]|uniref:GATA-type domain-containing protein n=1 Tax=Entomortierella parvispora TaxID=205924 RepID=A0A9P3HLB7_9FUNG|nr:hypothetical protein EMPS_11055 [Entomortierella parvispora]